MLDIHNVKHALHCVKEKIEGSFLASERKAWRMARISLQLGVTLSWRGCAQLTGPVKIVATDECKVLRLDPALLQGYSSRPMPFLGFTLK